MASVRETYSSFPAQRPASGRVRPHGAQHISAPPRGAEQQGLILTRCWELPQYRQLLQARGSAPWHCSEGDSLCVQGGSPPFPPRSWDVSRVPFLPGWFGAAVAAGAGGCCPESSPRWVHPTAPWHPPHTVPLALPPSQLSPQGLAGQGARLSLPSAMQHTRLQRHWSLLHEEAFSGVPISTGTIPRARATSSASCFPNQQTPLEIELGTGAGPTAPNCSETAAGSRPGAKVLLRPSQPAAA